MDASPASLLAAARSDLARRNCERALAMAGLLIASRPNSRPARDGRETPEPPDYDRHVPIGDLPRWLRRSIDAFPAAPGYLRADREETERWRAWPASIRPYFKPDWCAPWGPVPERVAEDLRAHGR